MVGKNGHKFNAWQCVLIANSFPNKSASMPRRRENTFFAFFFLHFYIHARVWMFSRVDERRISKEPLVSHCHIHNIHTPSVLMGGWREAKLSVVNLFVQAVPKNWASSLAHVEIDRSTLMICYKEWSHAVVEGVVC